MNKKSLSAVLISAIVFSSALFSAAPATASDDDEGYETELFQDLEKEQHDIEKKVRDEIKRKYGPREHVQMPPLVVRLKQERSETEDFQKSQEIEAHDSDAHDSDAAESGVQSFSDAAESGGQSFSDASLGVENLVVTIPQSASTNKSVALVPTDVQNMSVVVGSPIEISSIRYTLKTPAEKFVEAASFGLIAMLISALGLAAVVSSRVIRRK